MEERLRKITCALHARDGHCETKRALFEFDPNRVNSQKSAAANGESDIRQPEHPTHAEFDDRPAIDADLSLVLRALIGHQYLCHVAIFRRLRIWSLGFDRMRKK